MRLAGSVQHISDHSASLCVIMCNNNSTETLLWSASLLSRYRVGVYIIRHEYITHHSCTPLFIAEAHWHFAQKMVNIFRESETLKLNQLHISFCLSLLRYS